MDNVGRWVEFRAPNSDSPARKGRVQKMTIEDQDPVFLIEAQDGSLVCVGGGAYDETNGYAAVRFIDPPADEPPTSRLARVIALFEEEDIRIERMLHIPLAFSDTSSPSDELMELLKYEDPEDWPPELSRVLEDFKDDGADLDEMCEALVDAALVGFVVQLATPIRKCLQKPADCFSCSWGYYTTKWFFVPEMDALEATAKAWIAGLFAKWRAEVTS